MAMQHFYYNKQVKNYLTQFMAIFAGMRCEIGKRDDEGEQLITVPIHYGNKDRVVAHILGDNTQNKPLRLPIMSANIAGINPAPDLQKGIGQKRRQTHMPRGGLFPDDIQVIHQLMPIPYRMMVDLSIFASNMDQRLQILEQILMLFDPIVQIQTNDAPFDWTKIVSVKLDGINLEDNYPAGTDRRMLVSTLNFEVQIWISAPANVKDDYVKDIKVRIGAVDMAANTPEEMIANLDAQGIDYEDWFSLDDINLP